MSQRPTPKVFTCWSLFALAASACVSSAMPEPTSSPGERRDAVHPGSRAEVQPDDVVEFEKRFHEALAKDGGDRLGPTVKPLLDTFVPAVTALCQRSDIAAATRSATIRLLSATQDRRAIPCFNLALRSYVDGAEDEDARAVLGCVRATRFGELADGVFHVFRTVRFSRADARPLGKAVTEALLAVVEARHEEELLAALGKPWPAKDAAAAQDEAFWQTVAARALGHRNALAAVKPLLTVIVTPEKSSIATTALVALVRIGKPAVDITADAMAGAGPEHVGTYGEVLGALGTRGSREHLLAQLKRTKDQSQRVLLTLALTQTPRNDELWDAYQRVFGESPPTLDTPAGLAKEVIVSRSSDLLDARVVPWLIKSVGSIRGAGEDVQALRALALISAAKLMTFEQMGEVERSLAKGDGSFAQEFALAKEVLEQCKGSIECHLKTLTREDNQTKDRQFAAVKAAVMIGVLGSHSDAARVVEALTKLTNPAVRGIALKAVESLLPDGDLKIAARLDELYAEAELAGDAQAASDRRVFTQAAMRLRARSP